MANDPQLEREPTQELSQGGQPLPAREAELRRGDVLAARYEIQELLGKGGMASVYRAFDRVTEQAIAIKVLDPDRSAAHGWVEHLGRELRHARRIKHPNVCQVFDFFEDDGRCFLTMELAPGGTLRDALDAAPVDRPLADRLSDARAVIDGVAAIHEAGVVHRDLKPENVLRAADGRLLVSDLGVAIRADLTTHSAGPAGTRSYMAPELLFGEKATKASDIWSLGLVLHEILFGRRPEWSIAGAVRRLNVPEGAAGNVLQNLVRLCAACLVEIPDKRVTDAIALRRRFEEALRGRRSRSRRVVPFVAIALLVLAAATFLVPRKRRDWSNRGVLTGTAVELAKDSVPVFTINRGITRCAQMLPGGKTLRLYLRQPREAIDVDVAGGGVTPSNLVPEANVSGCPMLSPDGRRLLFERPRQEGRPQVFLSEWPDGRDAKVVTEGDGPYWLPSGDAFLYAVDPTRSAVFVLGRGPVQFPDPGTGPRTLSYHGVSGRGDQIAMLTFTSVPHLKIDLDIFSWPQTAPVRRLELPLGSCSWIEFDAGRGSWQLSMLDPVNTIRCELREDGSCARLLRYEGANVVSSYRSQLGLVGVVSRRTERTTLTRKSDGKVQEYVYRGTADFGPRGEAVLGVPSGDGRWMIGVQRFGEPGPRIVTSGPWDVSPFINPDGRTFLYNGNGGHDVFVCQLDAAPPGNCRFLHRDPLAPIYARLSPDGLFLAYNVADATGWRLRVVPMNGGPMRDLGLLSGGRILWTSNTTLWSCEGDARKWSEVDVVSGRFTGKAVWRLDSDAACDNPPPGVGVLADFEVKRDADVSTEVHLVRGM